VLLRNQIGQLHQAVLACSHHSHTLCGSYHALESRLGEVVYATPPWHPVDDERYCLFLCDRPSIVKGRDLLSAAVESLVGSLSSYSRNG